MVNARSCACAAVVDGAIYCVGGWGLSGKATRQVEVLVGGTWRPAPPMCTARANARATVLDGVLYVSGGFGGSNSLNSVECFRDGVWRPAHPTAVDALRIAEESAHPDPPDAVPGSPTVYPIVDSSSHDIRRARARAGRLSDHGEYLIII